MHKKRGRHSPARTNFLRPSSRMNQNRDYFNNQVNVASIAELFKIDFASFMPPFFGGIYDIDHEVKD
jgi:hypothetical protein